MRPLLAGIASDSSRRVKSSLERNEKTIKYIDPSVDQLSTGPALLQTFPGGVIFCPVAE